MKYRKKLLVRAFWSAEGATYHKQWGDQLHEGEHWVIIGPEGDVYGCETVVFRQTYELVDRDQDMFRKTGLVRAHRIEDKTKIETLEGPAVGKPGDWLIVNSTGEEYFASDSYFLKTYELVVD